jgi:putative flippase GtrA
VSTGWQFLRFLAIGALNTLFGYSVFAALVLAGVASVPALVLTYVVGVTFNFFTTRRFVFGRTAQASIVRFVAAYVVIYFFNLGIFKVAELAGAGPLLAQALCLPVVAVFSFFLFKFQVFRDPT